MSFWATVAKARSIDAASERQGGLCSHWMHLIRHRLSQVCDGTLSGLNRVCWLIWVVFMVFLNCQLLYFSSCGEKELLFTYFWWLNDNTECWRWLSHCALHHSSQLVKEPAIIWTFHSVLNMCLPGQISSKSYVYLIWSRQMSTLSSLDR